MEKINMDEQKKILNSPQDDGFLSGRWQTILCLDFLRVVEPKGMEVEVFMPLQPGRVPDFPNVGGGIMGNAGDDCEGAIDGTSARKNINNFSLANTF